MAERHDGGVGGMMSRISGTHYRAFKLQPLSRLSATAPLTQGRWHAVGVTERFCAAADFRRALQNGSLLNLSVGSAASSP